MLDYLVHYNHLSLGVMSVGEQKEKKALCNPVLSVCKWFPWLLWDSCVSQLYFPWEKHGITRPWISRAELLAEPIYPTLPCQHCFIFFFFSLFFFLSVLNLFVFFYFRLLKIDLLHLEVPAHHHKHNYKAWVEKCQLNPDRLKPQIGWNRPHDCLPQQKPA